MSVYPAHSPVPIQPQQSYQSTDLTQRLELEYLAGSGTADSATFTEFTEDNPGQDVIAGLSQNPKTLPPHYFYDDRGSQLFEQICQLPEYYPTRTEAAILQQFAGAIAHLTGPCEIVELGSGSSAKTRLLLDVYSELSYPLYYLPNDVSASILEISTQTLLKDYPYLHIRGLIGSYELALQSLTPTQLPARLICFLGSTLGNFSPQESDTFFMQITAALQTGDYFLLGVDLQKPRSILEAAYNDSQGVTAAFNLNVLRHLNRRFQGNFDPTQFSHWAFYNEAEQQIEMHLRSLRSQTVNLQALDLTVELTSGETIRTEISRKFNLEVMQQSLQARGLQPLQTWTDPKHWFGLILSQLH